MAVIVKYGNRLIRVSTGNSKQLEYSEDGGSIWQNLSTNVNWGDIYELTVNNNSNEIVAATANGMYYSNDSNAYSWYQR